MGDKHSPAPDSKLTTTDMGDKHSPAPDSKLTTTDMGDKHSPAPDSKLTTTDMGDKHWTRTCNLPWTWEAGMLARKLNPQGPLASVVSTSLRCRGVRLIYCTALY